MESSLFYLAFRRRSPLTTMLQTLLNSKVSCRVVDQQLLLRMATELLFNLSNLLVLPFWGLMIVLPRWQWTEKVMKSLIPIAVLASVYLYLFIGSLSSESAAALASPELSVIAQAFADEKIMAVGWVHYLVMDLFVGRWIYWQGRETGVWTVHSLILCLFAGPIGLLSHLITAAITERWGKGGDSTAETPQTEVG